MRMELDSNSHGFPRRPRLTSRCPKIPRFERITCHSRPKKSAFQLAMKTLKTIVISLAQSLDSAAPIGLDYINVALESTAKVWPWVNSPIW
jgi:hypothetical protein